MKNVHQLRAASAATADTLDTSVAILAAALAKAQTGSKGLLIERKAFGTLNGPSGGPELLALVFADDSVFGYWYGHVLPHPKRRGTYVAVIAWSTHLVDAPTIPLLFARFHYWMKDRLEYEPCSTQRDGDVYSEAANLTAAASSLGSMIQEFKYEKRAGSDGTPYEKSPVDLRVLDVYGMDGACDEHGRYGPLPMLTSLTFVKNRP